MLRIHSLLIALLALALVAAACGDDDADTADETTTTAADTATEAEVDAADDSAETDADTDDTESDDGADAEESGDEVAGGDFPVTIESEAGSFTLESRPERIVSLSPAATEILFAIGAGEQVVAVDSLSTEPAEAPVTDLSGFDPNVEAIAAYEPDLVVVFFDANDLVAGLTELDIPVLFSATPLDLEGGYAEMAELGVATGRIDETADAIADLRAEMDAAFAAAPATEARVYHELDENYFSASSFGFVGSIYSELGLTNIADEADTDGFGFPQLTEEYIVEADPELIVITDQVAYTADDVAARPGWSEISAVRDGNIVVVNADVASRFGPRLPQFVASITDALATVGAGS